MIRVGMLQLSVMCILIASFFEKKTYTLFLSRLLSNNSESCVTVFVPANALCKATKNLKFICVAIS